MKTAHKNEETHCREVQKILDGKPPWVVVWGTTLIAVILIIIAAITWKLFFL